MVVIAIAARMAAVVHTFMRYRPVICRQIYYKTKLLYYILKPTFIITLLNLRYFLANSSCQEAFLLRIRLDQYERWSRLLQ